MFIKFDAVASALSRTCIYVVTHKCMHLQAGTCVRKQLIDVGIDGILANI